MIHWIKYIAFFFSFNKPYVLRISIMEAEVSFEISSTIFINFGIKNAIYYYHISVISYTQTDPTENWIHLKTEHLVLVRNFPYIFK